jgi:AhpD family alkylhydroperoxidase
MQRTDHIGPRDDEEHAMEARMSHPAMIVPDAMGALQAVGDAIGEVGLPIRTVELVNIRASQINGCAVCLEGHLREVRKAGEPEDHFALLPGWREAPYFSDAERAALALTEAVTRLADRADPVPDQVWAEAAAHYTEAELGALLLQIASINVWNRLNIATRQLAGMHVW